jgi:hypothetical protein
MAFMNYLDFSRKILSNMLKWKSEMEMHFLTKSTNLHVYSNFPTIITKRCCN